jgi:hypothetical protein
MDIEMPVGFLSDVMIAASQGMTGWCTIVQWDTNPTRPEMDKITILLDDDVRKEGEPDTLYITHEVIERGIRRFLHDRPRSNKLVYTWQETFTKTYNALPIGSELFAMYYRWLFQAVWDGDATLVDSEVADIIVQYGLFMEVMFE